MLVNCRWSISSEIVDIFVKKQGSLREMLGM